MHVSQCLAEKTQIGTTAAAICPETHRDKSLPDPDSFGISSAHAGGNIAARQRGSFWHLLPRTTRPLPQVGSVVPARLFLGWEISFYLFSGGGRHQPGQLDAVLKAEIQNGNASTWVCLPKLEASAEQHMKWGLGVQ